MTAADRADRYLAIPAGYADGGRGLRWSAGGDAIEDADGRTVAVAERLELVLDGAFARGSPPPFGYVAAVLEYASRSEGGFDRLRAAITRAGKGHARNLGRLVAELCAGLPGAPAPPFADVAEALHRRRRGYALAVPAAEPPLSRLGALTTVSARLRRHADADLDHWLKYGCAPTDAGAALAPAVEELPVRPADVWTLARLRPRLVGAAVLVAAVDAAVSLPPRRRGTSKLPLGGYADVTTRGDPAQLLPAQLALDPDEFVRRFASGELLYFAREEPHAAVRPDRVVVLDQGVRTWGSVRLGLAAAALALLKPGRKHTAGLGLACTSTTETFDLDSADPTAVADALEASDLSADPGDCLRGVLTAPDDAPRDVILLTHPRALGEPAVTATAAECGPADRLFALAVDADGRATLSEWRAAGLTELRTFRVDLAAAEAARVAGPAPPAPANALPPGWAGDVEPVPFPFRPGLVADVYRLGFDAAGDWLVTAGHTGILHAIGTDGSGVEVPPRAFRDGVVFTNVQAVLGVDGGVVVCGEMRLPVAHAAAVSAGAPAREPRLVAAHYDRAARRVTLHDLGADVPGARWVAFPDVGCVAARSDDGRGAALDLATGGWHTPAAGTSDRAAAAWGQAAAAWPSPAAVRVAPPWPTDPGPEPYLTTLPVTPPGPALLVRNIPAGNWRFTPTRDGAPLTAGAVVTDAQLAGATLALKLHRVGATRHELVLLHGPDGKVLGEAPVDGRLPFTLSPGGNRFARGRGKELVVTDAHDLARPLAVAAPGRLHTGVKIRLLFGAGDLFSLHLWAGAFHHEFGLDGNVLVRAFSEIANPPEPSRTLATGRASGLPTGYDADRFAAKQTFAAGPWVAAVDRLGQVVLMARNELVALFVIRRRLAAAWAPPGVLWGDAALLGGPPTPDAAAVIGERIRRLGEVK